MSLAPLVACALTEGVETLAAEDTEALVFAVGPHGARQVNVPDFTVIPPGWARLTLDYPTVRIPGPGEEQDINHPAALAVGVRLIAYLSPAGLERLAVPLRIPEQVAAVQGHPYAQYLFLRALTTRGLTVNARGELIPLVEEDDGMDFGDLATADAAQAEQGG